MAVLALTALISGTSVSQGGNGLYIAPSSGEYELNEYVSLHASRSGGTQDPEGQDCCGSSGSGIYEFYDITNYNWSGAVVNVCEDSAELNTTSAGQKSVTCTADINYRCTGNSEITDSTPVSEIASYTVGDSFRVDFDDHEYVPVGESIPFTATPSGGVPSVTYQWNPGNALAQDTLSSQTVNLTFSSPGENSISVEATDSANTLATKNKTVSAVQVSGGEDIWFFETGGGNFTHPVKCTLSIAGVKAGDSTTWKITQSKSAAKFSNNQDEISGTATSQVVTSEGWTNKNGQPVKVIAMVGGRNVCEITFAVKIPTVTEEAGPVLDTMDIWNRPGYAREYIYTIKDNYSDDLSDIWVGQDFSNDTTHNGSNWKVRGPNGIHEADNVFSDNFSRVENQVILYSPPPVSPSHPNAGVLMNSVDQSYRIGGAGFGPTMTGFEVYKGKAKFYRGTFGR